LVCATACFCNAQTLAEWFNQKRNHAEKIPVATNRSVTELYTRLFAKGYSIAKKQVNDNWQYY